MGDGLPEKLYMAWRSSLLSTVPDLPSWGNVRDPDVRAAWEAAARVARAELGEQFRRDMRAARQELGADEALANLLDETRWSAPS